MHFPSVSEHVEKQNSKEAKEPDESSYRKCFSW
jgi:hypothetical protein